MADASPADVMERRIQDVYARLAESVAVVRRCHEHYLDDLTFGGPGQSGVDPFAAVTELAAGHPWALGGFGDSGWDSYQPDLGAGMGTARTACGCRSAPTARASRSTS